MADPAHIAIDIGHRRNTLFYDDEVGWTSKITNKLKSLKQKSWDYTWIHRENSAYLNDVNDILTVGGACLSLLNAIILVFRSSVIYIQIFTMILSFGAGLVQVMNKLKNYPEMIQKHKMASSRFSTIFNKVEQQLSLPISMRQNPLHFHGWISSQFDTLFGTAPDIDGYVIDKYRQNIAKIKKTGKGRLGYALEADDFNLFNESSSNSNTSKEKQNNNPEPELPSEMDDAYYSYSSRSTSDSGDFDNILKEMKQNKFEDDDTGQNTINSINGETRSEPITKTKSEPIIKSNIKLSDSEGENKNENDKNINEENINKEKNNKEKDNKEKDNKEKDDKEKDDKEKDNKEIYNYKDTYDDKDNYKDKNRNKDKNNEINEIKMDIRENKVVADIPYPYRKKLSMRFAGSDSDEDDYKHKRSFSRKRKTSASKRTSYNKNKYKDPQKKNILNYEMNRFDNNLNYNDNFYNLNNKTIMDDVANLPI